jgi:hypothetical protein
MNEWDCLKEGIDKAIVLRVREEKRRRKTEGRKTKTYQNRKERCLKLRAVDGSFLENYFFSGH